MVPAPLLRCERVLSEADVEQYAAAAWMRPAV
jgi:hypothetical protein